MVISYPILVLSLVIKISFCKSSLSLQELISSIMFGHLKFTSKRVLLFDRNLF